MTVNFFHVLLNLFPEYVNSFKRESIEKDTEQTRFAYNQRSALNESQKLSQKLHEVLFFESRSG